MNKKRIEEKVGRLSDLTPNFEIFPTKVIFNDFDLDPKEVEIVLNLEDLTNPCAKSNRKRGSILKRGISKLVTADMIKKDKSNLFMTDQQDLQKVLTKLSQSVVTQSENKQTFGLVKRETIRLDQRPRLNFFRHCLLSMILFSFFLS